MNLTISKNSDLEILVCGSICVHLFERLSIAKFVGMLVKSETASNEKIESELAKFNPESLSYKVKLLRTWLSGR